MSMLKQIFNYLNIFLAVMAVVVLIVFLSKLIKLKPTLKIINDDTELLTKDLEHANKTVEKIQNTARSWMFISSLYVLFVVIRETIKYSNKSDSVSKSFAKSVARHARQISSIRF